MRPELTNERAHQEWAWLVRRFGQAQAEAALVRAVERGRRPFPLNAARELGVTLPSPEELRVLFGAPRSDEVLARIREIKALLKRKA